ncbi:hypothetical protein PYW08_009626 [Mythimna loreyi]|uniref:Uncharacterized protein n=1 Tax=Mythimna loreyi TaxID=667449 RepID=A0ACC2Q6X3_9NEOP|nr:hypothetical protein PYW08_009626 [Mythimna loreyi]
MLEIVAGFLVIWICVILYWRARLVESKAHPLPPAFPGLLPIIGHTHLLLTNTSTLWRRIKRFSDYSLEKGGLIYGKLGFRESLYYFITDPDDALLVANTCLDKHFLYGFAKYWLGEGLITGSGNHWHRHRQLLKQSFSLPIINGYLEVFNGQSRKLLSTLEGSAEKGKFIPTAQIKRFSLGSSYLTTFGKASNGEKTIQRYMKATDEMLCLVMERFQKVWLHNEFIYTLLGYKKQEADLLECREEVANEISQTKKSFFNKIHDQSTYIPYQPLIRLILEQYTTNQFTDYEISEELHTAIVAAYETTAGSLQSILVMIGSFPKVQEKMYEEIMQVLGADRDVDKEDLRKLVYTEAVVKESLRLLPTVPMIGRYIDRDVKLKNYTLRAGSNCMIFTCGLQRHSSWGPDVDEFRPERWLDPATLPPYIATDGAFSFGKRSCLGKTYAMTALKVAVAHIVRKYVITGDYTKLKYQLDITLKPYEGHDISLKRRS